ncbi:MAG: hypothetical protein ACYS7M_02705 [Planctomycetota bacterium]|jgi:hypothetical protein
MDDRARLKEMRCAILLFVALLVSPLLGAGIVAIREARAAEEKPAATAAVIAKDAELQSMMMKAAEARGQSLEEFLEWLKDTLDRLDKPAPPTPPAPNNGGLQIKVQPPEQEVGRPVAVTVSGVPQGPHYESFDWSPEHAEDFKLDLYDRAGNPVTIFWSDAPGTRKITMTVAVNGPEIPDVTTVKQSFKYGDEPDPPGPPVPVPHVTPPPEPTDAALKTLVAPIATMLQGDPESGTSMAGFWMAVADATRRDTNLAKTSDLRKFLSLAEENAYLSTGFAGKFPGFSKLVNEGYGSYVGLVDEPLDAVKRAKSAAFFEGVAWACFPRGA